MQVIDRAISRGTDLVMNDTMQDRHEAKYTP